MKKRMLAALLAGIVVCSHSACAASTSDTTTTTPPATGADKPTSSAVLLETEKHLKYVNGNADGTFAPDAPVSRAEVAQMLFSLLREGAVTEKSTMPDVSADAWYAEAVNTLSGAGLVKGDANSAYRPADAMTRAEFVTLIARFFTDAPTSEIKFEFADLSQSHWAYDAVQYAASVGWMQGYPSTDASGGMNVRPDAPVTRAEAVKIINRAIGRMADTVMIMTSDDIRVMPDVPVEHWAYYEMLEASTAHEYALDNGVENWTSHAVEQTPLAAGFHNLAGRLYYVGDNKQFVRDTTIEDVLTFDHNGRYTTGDEALDLTLATIASQVVNDKMTQMEKLRAMYDYAKAHLGYQPTGIVDSASGDWAPEKAQEMLTSKRGNCYSWASAFTYLARQVGYPAIAMAGTGVSAKGSESVHGWTEITIDGTKYTFDPQIESIYASRYGENYDLFQKEYGAAEWGYKDGVPSGGAMASGGESTPAGEADAQLAALMDQVYGTVETAKMQRTPLNAENCASFLGVDSLPGMEAGLASEPMMTSFAHSIVLVRMADGSDIEAAKTAIRENVDNYKWVCVGVDKSKVIVENVGNIIALIMDEESGQTYLANFKAAL